MVLWRRGAHPCFWTVNVFRRTNAELQLGLDWVTRARRATAKLELGDPFNPHPLRFSQTTKRGCARRRFHPDFNVRRLRAQRDRPYYKAHRFDPKPPGMMISRPTAKGRFMNVPSPRLAPPCRDSRPPLADAPGIRVHTLVPADLRGWRRVPRWMDSAIRERDPLSWRVTPRLERCIARSR